MAKDLKPACAGRQNGVSLIINFFTAFCIFFIRRVRAMNNAIKFEISNSENGVSLIITFFIMIIILSVVLSVSIILYSEVKVIRNIGNSTGSLYAAESGVEKILYYDRQVIETGAKRGLCSMYLYNLTNNPKACRDNSLSGFDPSIYCNSPSIPPVAGSTDPTLGCDPNVCDDCTVNFSTTFDNRKYSITANVSSNYLDVTSSGTFPISGGAERKIEAITPKQ